MSVLSVLQSILATTGSAVGLVTAVKNCRTMQPFFSHIAWESEVWIADAPEHMIHFNGGRFLGPYADVMPKKT